MVEVSFVGVILVVALAGLSSAVLSGMRLERATEETAVAHDAARAMVERIRNVPFAERFATFNANPLDDPGGVGTAPGSGFDVVGLTSRDGDVDGFVGAVDFPTVGTALREDVVDDGLGMPRDLSGDGLSDGEDHSDDYILLPMRVRIEWTGASGNRALEFGLLMVE